LALWSQATVAVCLAQVSGNNPFDTPEGRLKGQELFEAHCVYCHGPHGEGGRGANLTKGVYRYGSSDREIFDTIRNGIKGTEMPPVRVTNDEVWQMVAYVKSLVVEAPKEIAPGDAAAGRQIFEGKGHCASCHSVNGNGGYLGPDLTRAGKRRSLRFLTESIVDPAARIDPQYRAVEVVTKANVSVRGIRLNEDDLSIQIRDTDGNLRSFLKTDLREIRRDRPALMPSYRDVLSGKEIADLVAYLSSLRGQI
jgi:putative heme-binding domain-containing protein